MSTPPLPPDQPTPPLPPTGPSTTAIIIRCVIGGCLIGLIVFIALATSCPDERQMRDALYGEIGPKYKRSLEWFGVGSKLLHGPHLVYRNHVIYSTLDFDKGSGNEIRLASGRAGKVELTPEAKDVKTLLLSTPAH